MVAAGAVVAPGTVVRSGEIWGGERWAASLTDNWPWAAVLLHDTSQHMALGS